MNLLAEVKASFEVSIHYPTHYLPVALVIQNDQVMSAFLLRRQK